MICSRCKIDVKPDMPLMTCPECWSPIKLRWNPSVHGGEVNKAIKHRGAVYAAAKLGCLPAHTRTMDLYFDMMMKFDRLYDLNCEYDPDIDFREGDSVIEIEEKVIVQAIIAAAIVSFFVMNEIFHFIKY